MEYEEISDDDKAIVHEAERLWREKTLPGDPSVPEISSMLSRMDWKPMPPYTQEARSIIEKLVNSGDLYGGGHVVNKSYIRSLRSGELDGESVIIAARAAYIAGRDNDTGLVRHVWKEYIPYGEAGYLQINLGKNQYLFVRCYRDGKYWFVAAASPNGVDWGVATHYMIINAESFITVGNHAIRQ
jgi:hypothetical protein